jgi:Reverse transcriptase (RNA-dependent DNA polymerase)
LALLQNLRTGYISPQNHVVYDEAFTSVSSFQSLNSEEYWNDLYLHHRDHYVEDFFDIENIPPLHDSWLTAEELRQRQCSTTSTNEQEDITTVPSTSSNSLTSNDATSNTINEIQPRNLIDDLNSNATSSPHTLDGIELHPPTSLLQNQSPDSPQPPASPLPIIPEQTVLVEPPNNNRPQLEQKANRKYFGDQWVNVGLCSRTKLGVVCVYYSKEASFLAKLGWTNINTPVEEKFSNLLYRTDPYTNEVVHGEMGYNTHLQTSDSPTLTEILSMEDTAERQLWFDAMDEEIGALLSEHTFQQVLQMIATEKNAEIVGTTWVFKRKRRPDGTIVKYKARLVVHGDQQKVVGRTIDETYAPVVEWSSIRLLLTLAVTQNLCTTQIDFKNAFVQSDLPNPIYVELPPGGYRNHPDNKGMILEVNKSLYGDRWAPKLWYMFLRAKLEKIGFEVDDNDPCLFTKPGCIFVNYVDDGIFVAEDQETIQEVLARLKEQQLDFDEMGSLMDYLGVHVGECDTPDSI